MDHEKILEFQSLDERPGHPGGRKPLPLKSSWHLNERFPLPDRKPVYWFYIDDLQGRSLCRCKDIETAYEYLESMLPERGVIRPVCIDEALLEEERQARKKKSQYGY